MTSTINNESILYNITDKYTFSQFYTNNKDYIARYISVMFSNNNIDIENVISEAFLKAWKNRNKFAGNVNEARQWVIKIAHNYALDRIRKNNRLKLIPFYKIDNHSNNLIENQVIDGINAQHVLSKINTLPYKNRQMVIMRHVLDWSIKDIASYMNMKENTVSIAIKRSLLKVAELYNIEYGEFHE